jgi:hypothetical protein
VIYTLIGCAPGERCGIERTENGFVTREEYTSAANDWAPSRPMWEARIAAGGYEMTNANLPEQVTQVCEI